MKTDTKPTHQPDPMESLAQEIEGQAAAITADQAAQDPAAQEAAANEAQAMAALESGMLKLTFGVFKVGRSLASRKLPELRDEWTDPVIQAPAEAAVPLLKKYMGTVFEKMSDKPELAIFAMSVLPMVMGYMDALDKHEKALSKAVAGSLDAMRAEFLVDPVAI